MYNKASKEWTTEMEMNVRSHMGNEFIATLEQLSDQRFESITIGILEISHMSNREQECMGLAAESGNRIRVFHNAMVIMTTSEEFIAETQGQGVDQEDIDQHGFHDETYNLELLRQVSSDMGIAGSCPLLNDMDHQDLVHTYSK